MYMTDKNIWVQLHACLTHLSLLGNILDNRALEKLNTFNCVRLRRAHIVLERILSGTVNDQNLLPTTIQIYL